MLIRIDFETLNERGTFYPEKHVRRVLGTPAQIGTYVADLLLEEWPIRSGEEIVIKTMSMNIMADPEVL